MRILLIGLALICLLYACNVDDTHSKEVPVSNEKYPTVLDFNPGVRDHNQRIRLAPKYGFELVTVIPEGFVGKEKDSALKANEVTFKKLEKRNGPDWKNRFEQEVAAMYKKDTMLISILKADPEILAKEIELSRFGNRLDFYIDTFLVNGSYRINVYGPTGTSNKTVSFFRVFIDSKTLKIIRKDEKIAPFGKN